jgi:hypothetical protein
MSGRDMKVFGAVGAALLAAVACCGGSAQAEVQKILNLCGNQLCPSFRLVLTPPDGWVVDEKASKENHFQIMVPKGKNFRSAEPLMYVQVFYHRDKQQSLADFAKASNERWLAINGSAKIVALAAVPRANGKDGFLRFGFENPDKPQQAFEQGALGIDADRDGNEFVLDVVMSGNSKAALARAEDVYIAFLKAN